VISLGRWAARPPTPRGDAPIVSVDSIVLALRDTDPGTLDAVLWGGRSLADAQRSGTMTIEGDKAAVERFVALFPMPEPAAAVTPA
jgi:hypothetical protein